VLAITNVPSLEHRSRWLAIVTRKLHRLSFTVGISVCIGFHRRLVNGPKIQRELTPPQGEFFGAWNGKSTAHAPGVTLLSPFRSPPSRARSSTTPHTTPCSCPSSSRYRCRYQTRTAAPPPPTRTPYLSHRPSIASSVTSYSPSPNTTNGCAASSS
jgi:hypothetical protein